jgi:serine O-acetyltransferase
MLGRPTTSRPRSAPQAQDLVETVHHEANLTSRADTRASTLRAAKPVLEETRDSVRHPLISADIPDWTREACSPTEWSPSRQLLKAIRDYQEAVRTPGSAALARTKLAVARHRFWSAVCACDVPINSQLGGGLLLPHPSGVVLHPAARIGPNCLLFQQVTIGTGLKPGVPTLGGHVDVGAGAKILGGVHIGDHVVIGANAVVLSDVPSYYSVPALTKH